MPEQIKMGLLQLYCVFMMTMLQNFVPLSFQSYDGSNKNLNSIPEDIPAGSTGIKLDRNNIAQVTDGSFVDSKFSQVVTVTLESNVITTVSRRAFAGFSSLSILILESNKLEELEILASDLSSIRELSLKSNSLKGMPQFTGSFNSLKLLDLAKNKIQHVDPQAFENVQNIERLDLTSNKLVEFGIVNELSKLKVLLLGVNKLETMPRLTGYYTKKSLNVNLIKNKIGIDSFLEFQKHFNISSSKLKTFNIGRNPTLVNHVSTVLNYLTDHFPSLTSIGLKSMEITKIPDVNYSVFQKITLDLTDNLISTFTVKDLERLRKVETLTLVLEDNPVNSISDPFSYFSSGIKWELDLNKVELNCENFCWMLKHRYFVKFNNGKGSIPQAGYLEVWGVHCVRTLMKHKKCQNRFLV